MSLIMRSISLEQQRIVACHITRKLLRCTDSSSVQISQASTFLRIRNEESAIYNSYFTRFNSILTRFFNTITTGFDLRIAWLAGQQKASVRSA